MHFQVHDSDDGLSFLQLEKLAKIVGWWSPYVNDLIFIQTAVIITIILSNSSTSRWGLQSSSNYEPLSSGTKDAQKYDASGDHWQQERSNVAKSDLGMFLMGLSLSETMTDPQGSMKMRTPKVLTH